MKSALAVFVCAVFLSIGLSLSMQAQTNVFPATGYVGIGTTSPTTTLDVNGFISVGGSDLSLENVTDAPKGRT